MKDFTVASIFQDNMVIQRDKKFCIWGTAQAEHVIEVSLKGQNAKVKSTKDGQWKIVLPSISASENEEIHIQDYTGGGTIQIRNVAIGEVWVAGGQSNMEYLMKYDADRYRELKKPENPQIRFYDVPHIAFEGDDNQTEHQGIWRIANRENLPYYSAVAYYFAKDIHESTGVTVGIVGCNWGGTTALTWIDRERLKGHPILKKYWLDFCRECGEISEEEYENRFWECRRIFREFDNEYIDEILYGISWGQQLEHMERLKTLPLLPMGKWDTNAPGNLFESMVKTIAGFSVKGILWYQGEGDRMRADNYACLFREVITSWRNAWNDELPFLFVQLAPFYRWLGEDGREYPKVRRQQEMISQEVSSVWMTSSTDCGMKWDIHPKRKQPIGKRLALLARGKIYGEDIVCEPPECMEAHIHGSKIELYFSSVGAGLKQADAIQRGIYVCYGEKRAEASVIECEGNKITVNNPDTGRKPDSISFMEEAYGECLIYNSAGIPLKPFHINITERDTWWKESVVYQIYPRSFQDSNGDGIGDLQGITSRIPYLKELGIDVIWLSPVYQSPNDDNGYDISDYQKIMEEFGTMLDFEQMLKTAHNHGIRIMMDLVVNHTSDEHLWFVESRKAKDNPYRDYYIWREGKEDGSLPNNWGSCFSGTAWEYDEATEMYYLHLFSKKQPDLNWNNPKVRKEIHRMMNWWIDKGIDGFRMDVISLISKNEDFPDGKPELNGYTSFNETANGPHVHEYLQEMNEKVLTGRNLITVGECSGVTLEEAKKYANSDGSELNMVFQFEHMDVDSKDGNKWTDRKMYLPDLKKIMGKWQKGLQNVAWNSLFWCNHDQPRVVSRFGNDSHEYRELSAKMLATCLHMMQGTPYIYQGEELGMTNVPFEDISDFRDIDSINAFHELTKKEVYSEEQMMRYIRYKSRDNARTPMQWNDEKNAGFTDGNPWIMVNPNYREINVKEQLSRKDSVFYYYQKLIQLRHENKIIIYGTYEPYMEDSEEVFAYIRAFNVDNCIEKILVLCNFIDNEVAIEIPEEFKGGSVLISNYENTVKDLKNLRPYEAIVIKIQID